MPRVGFGMRERIEKLRWDLGAGFWVFNSYGKGIGSGYKKVEDQGRL